MNDQNRRRCAVIRKILNSEKREILRLMAEIEEKLQWLETQGVPLAENFHQYLSVKHKAEEALLKNEKEFSNLNAIFVHNSMVEYFPIIVGSEKCFLYIPRL